MTWRQRCALLVATGLVVGGAWTSPAGASNRSGEGVTVARGRATVADGTPAAGGEVLLLAWPADEDLEATQPGDAVAVTQVASSVVADDGTWELRLKNPTAVLPFRSHRSGDVDLEVVLLHDGVATPFAFSRVADRTTGRLTSGAGAPDVLTVELAAVRSEGRGRPRSSDDPDTPGATADADDSAAVEAIDMSVITTHVKDYAAKWDLVAQTYNVGTGWSNKVTYKSNASSRLGIGVSPSGAFGTFKAEGTKTQSSTAELGFPVQSGAGKYTYFDTQFVPALYKITACGPMGGACDTWYEARVKSFAGGTRTRSLSSYPSASYCTPYKPGSYLTKDSSTAVQWTNGWDMDGNIGIDLSSQTGYTTTISLTYQLSSQSTSSRNLCGTGDYPAGTPRQIVAK